MRAPKYIVCGLYECEKHHYHVDGSDVSQVLSAHRDLDAAWRAAERAHYALGGVSGEHILTHVEQRLTAAQAALLAALMADTETHSPNPYCRAAREHAGALYADGTTMDEIARRQS